MAPLPLKAMDYAAPPPSALPGPADNRLPVGAGSGTFCCGTWQPVEQAAAALRPSASTSTGSAAKRRRPCGLPGAPRRWWSPQASGCSAWRQSSFLKWPGLPSIAVTSTFWSPSHCTLPVNTRGATSSCPLRERLRLRGGLGGELGGRAGLGRRIGNSNACEAAKARQGCGERESADRRAAPGREGC